MERLLNHFARPEVLWLLPVLFAVWLLALWGRRRKRQAMYQLGWVGAVQKLLLVQTAARKWRGRALFLALPLLLIGSAGPRWGLDFSKETAHRQDIVVALDVSLSMFAEQPSRLERAVRALRDLADHLQKQGGQRLALVVFAARPQLLFPLTNDYDHFRLALDAIEAGDLPPGIQPSAVDPPPSGTRIGAGISLAVEAFASRDDSDTTPRAILLLSDGDDPVPDQEWREGVRDAKTAHVPVHTVGIGDPRQESGILIDGDFLRFEGTVIKTRLHEKVLQAIAEQTGAAYLPAQTSDVPLGQWLPSLLQTAPSNGGAGKLAALPVLHPRQGWLLWPALALLATTLLLRDAPSRAGEALRNPRAMILTPALPCIALIFVAMLQIAADSPGEDWIRQANAAFHHDDLERALSLYEKAEAVTTDPGLVSLNKAAALYRLKRYREAELHYFRCLEDDQASRLRQAQASFGLGIALLRQAGEKDLATLNRAIDAFAVCIQKNANAELTADAQFNLELARWLRLKIPPETRDKEKDQEKPKDVPPNAKTQTKNKPGLEKKDSKGNASPSKEEPKKGETGTEPDEPGQGKLAQKLANAGRLQSIPDDSELKPLPPEDTAAHLERLAERIANDRRRYQRRQIASAPQMKNW